MEDNVACMLVVIGATPEGGKELVGFQVGVFQRTQSWRVLLIDLKARGLSIAPENFPSVRHQRCRQRTLADILN
jgi:putative transposase